MSLVSQKNKNKKKKRSQITACTSTFLCFCLLCSHSFHDDENGCARSRAGQWMQSKEMTRWDKSPGTAVTAEKWHMTRRQTGGTPGVSGTWRWWVETCHSESVQSPGSVSGVVSESCDAKGTFQTLTVVIVFAACSLEIRLEAAAADCRPWGPWGGTSDMNWTNPGLNIAFSQNGMCRRLFLSAPCWDCLQFLSLCWFCLTPNWDQVWRDRNMEMCRWNRSQRFSPAFTHPPWED